MPVPTSLALTTIAADAEIVSSTHNNNNTAIQSAVNAIIGFLNGASLNDAFLYDGTNWAGGKVANANVSATAAVALTKLASTGQIGSGAVTVGAAGKAAIAIADTGAQLSGITVGGDTKWYRSSAGTWKSDGQIQAVATGGAYALLSVASLATDAAYGSFVTGSGTQHWGMLASGKQQWGDGTNAFDLNIYRAGVAQGKSDHNWQFVDGVATKVKAGTPTDADFATTPPVGTIVVDTTASKIWVRTAGATWKGVVVA